MIRQSIDRSSHTLADEGDSSFAGRVLAWFAEHGRRDLPWQKEPTPYRVWISEIMLQQTQVATVIPYFQRFMAAFPDVMTLATANIDDVLHHWSGLGYYARARNLHKTARILCDEHGGDFPDGLDDVVALPGIGRSTAAAILALSRGERHAILDGNVKRVLARYHAIAGWPGSTAVANALWKRAGEHLPADSVAAYTQAMMDLGATVCTRARPRCDACPLVVSCAAHASGTQSAYPGRKAKSGRPRRRTHMLLIRCADAIYLERRPAAGIWGGLWSFPELESADDVAGWCERTLHAEPDRVEPWDLMSHSFTHFDLDIQPIAVNVSRRPSTVADGADSTWYQPGSGQQLGIAAPVMQLLRNLAGTAS